MILKPEQKFSLIPEAGDDSFRGLAAGNLYGTAEVNHAVFRQASYGREAFLLEDGNPECKHGGTHSIPYLFNGDYTIACGFHQIQI